MTDSIEPEVAETVERAAAETAVETAERRRRDARAGPGPRPAPR